MNDRSSGTRDRWTVLSLVEWASSHLASKGFDESRLTVELLLAHVLTLRRLDLYLQFDRPLLPEELAGFKALYTRRLSHEPVQYILGETDFMGLRLAVGAGALVPRPETEFLVECALEVVGGRPACAILDVGTGTGNVALALAQRVAGSSVVSIDVSSDALSWARRNAETLGIQNVAFELRDVLADPFSPGSIDLLVSNPPYISVEEYQKLEPDVRDFEPQTALCDGGDGLKFYRRLAAVAATILNDGGWVVVEVGCGQATDVERLFRDAGLTDVASLLDFAGIPRVVKGKR